MISIFLKNKSEYTLAILVPLIILFVGISLAFFGSSGIDNATLLALIVGAAALGGRHAFDADHIAGIDSVVRSLKLAGKPSKFVGMFFSIGHSTIVLVALLLVAVLGPSLLKGDLGMVTSFSTLFIASFLALVILMNVYGLVSRKHNSATGPMHLIFGKLLSRIQSQWQMVIVGVLFGLGLDTAIAMSLLASEQVVGDPSIAFYAALAFVFAGSMSLGDSVNTLIVNRVYDASDNVKVNRYQKWMTIIIIIAAAIVSISLWGEILGITLSTQWAIQFLELLGVGLAAIFVIGFLVARSYSRKNVL
jgi:high-affinity nickel-transport protein